AWAGGWFVVSASIVGLSRGRLRAMPAEDEQVAADADEAFPPPEPGSLATDGRRRFGRGWRIAISVVVVLAVAVFVASEWSVPYYSITPGHAFNIGTLISVPRSKSHLHKGAIVLTDVYLDHLSALGYLYYEIRDSSEIVGSSDVTGGQSRSTYDEEGVVDMSNARQAATLVALHTLGYPTKAVANGSVVYAVEPGTTIAEAPSTGSVIVATDGTPTLTADELVHAIGSHATGAYVPLTFHALGKTKTETRSYRLGVLVRSSKKTGSVLECERFGDHELTPLLAHGKEQACLPFGVVASYRNVGVPFKVALSSGGIVGPSAGLSFTLGLIEKLDRADLTNGMRVAATGTMSNDGAVGPVGGVAEKTRAVRAAGADVFLVPPSGLKAARANAGTHLKVIAVSSIGQAVSALERLGGRLEPADHGFQS
ncbi:MAG: S16 family serine protease, partial [Acidimicrobiales bacterium]